MAISSFSQLTAHLAKQRPQLRVAVVCPDDDSTLHAVERAEREKIIRPLMFRHSDPKQAAESAVAAVRAGEADVLMKGLVNSDVLLRAVLDKQGGLLQAGSVLTHITVAEMAAYPRLLFFTDAAVIPQPTQAQRMAQVRYILDMCRRFGIEKPRLSLLNCSEKVDPKNFPFTTGYQDIKAMAMQGEFGSCVVDGPLDLKTSCSEHSLEMKHIVSPLEGRADALVMPDIQSGNLFYKTITLFCQARTAAVLRGAQVPVVLPSRADSPESKYLSLCIACLL